MLTGSTLTTAILRGFYVAVVVGLIAGLSAYKADHQTVEDIITGLLAGLGALGVRGGLEGLYDSSRQSAGKVNDADVQPAGQGKA